MSKQANMQGRKKTDMRSKKNIVATPKLKKNSAKVVAAVFDIDKTIINGNSGQKYVWHLFMKGMIKPLYAIKINYFILRYLTNTLDYEKAMRYAYSITKGMQLEGLKKILKKYHEQKIRHMVYNDMKKLILEHRKKGRIIIFITNSWDLMVEGIARDLKPDMLFATRVEIKNGKLTGKLTVPCFGEYKRKYLIKAAKEKNIDLKNSFVYSDHISDLPMLEAVGNPTVVNPDSRLLKVAKKRNWPVFYPK